MMLNNVGRPLEVKRQNPQTPSYRNNRGGNKAPASSTPIAVVNTNLSVVTAPPGITEFLKGIPLTVVGSNNRREVTVFFRPEPWLAQLLGVAGRFGGSTVRSPSFAGLQFLARYRGSFTPKTSTRSISGGLENNSAALAMRALAIGPLR
jgi:hypothetical protein